MQPNHFTDFGVAIIKKAENTKTYYEYEETKTLCPPNGNKK